MIRVLVFVVTFLALPAAALAHPGHGHTDPNTLQHYLLEPQHLLLLVGGGFAIGLVFRRLRLFWRARRRWPR